MRSSDLDFEVTVLIVLIVNQDGSQPDHVRDADVSDYACALEVELRVFAYLLKVQMEEVQMGCYG